jgi:hypothetical protein
MRYQESNALQLLRHTARTHKAIALRWRKKKQAHRAIGLLPSLISSESAPTCGSQDIFALVGGSGFNGKGLCAANAHLHSFAGDWGRLFVR